MIVQLLPCWSLSVYRGENISSLQKRRPCLLATIQSHAPRSPYTSCMVHTLICLSHFVQHLDSAAAWHFQLLGNADQRGPHPTRLNMTRLYLKKLPKLDQTWLIVSQSKQVPLSFSRTRRLFNLLGCPPWVTGKTANDLIHCRCKQIKKHHKITLRSLYKFFSPLGHTDLVVTRPAFALKCWREYDVDPF